MNKVKQYQISVKRNGRRETIVICARNFAQAILIGRAYSSDDALIVSSL